MPIAGFGDEEPSLRQPRGSFAAERSRRPRPARTWRRSAHGRFSLRHAAVVRNYLPRRARRGLAAERRRGGGVSAPPQATV